MKSIALASMVAVLAISGCGTGVGFPLETDLVVLSGGTETAASGSADLGSPSVSGSAAATLGITATAGLWWATPDQVSSSITGVRFLPENAGALSEGVLVTPERCTFSWARTGSTLAELGRCKLRVPLGSYVAARVVYGAATAYLSDTSAGLSTIDSSPGFSGLSGTSAATAKFSAATDAFVRDKVLGLGERFDVKSGVTPATLYLVLDLTHSVAVTVPSSGSATVSAAGESFMLLSKPVRAAHYTTLGTSRTVADGASGRAAVSVLYASSTQPSQLVLLRSRDASPGCGAAGDPVTVFPRSHGASPSGALGAKFGGYLGADSNRVFWWAQPKTSAFSEWVGVVSMLETASFGTVVTLSAQCAATVTEPSNGSFAAGGPATFAPGSTAQLKLVTR